MTSAAMSTPLSSNATAAERRPPAVETYSWDPMSRAATKAGSVVSFAQHPLMANQERLLNAREVAARLGVSERWVRDHTTRRSPKIRGVKLGTLMRYRGADVEEFMERMTTSKSSLQQRFGG